MKLTGKLTTSALSALAVGIALVAVMAYVIAEHALLNLSVANLRYIAATSVERADTWVEARGEQVHGWSRADVLAAATPDTFVARAARRQAEALLKAYPETFPYYQAIILFNAAGEMLATSSGNDDDYAQLPERSFFATARNGEVVVSDTFSSAHSRSPVFVIAAPVHDRGGDVVGVLAAVVSLKSFTETYITRLSIGERGYTFMVDTDGEILAHPGTLTILRMNARDHSFGPVVMKGSGTGTFVEDNRRMIVSVATSARSGWIIAAVADRAEVMAPAWRMGMLSAGIAVVVMAIGGLGQVVLIRKIVKPIREVTRAAEDVAQGALDFEIQHTSTDEVGLLADAFRTMRVRLLEKQQAACAMAAGDLTVEVETLSSRDALGIAMRDMNTRLNAALSRIRGAVDEVSDGAGQISEAAQTLSQGASESGASLELISSSATEVGQQARYNAETAVRAKQLADTAHSWAEAGAQRMGDLTGAMARITESSNQIARIIRAIDDIAFQTNLLALNAAVEAARAGRHGKGFAVVAEEVRNLAARSAKAARETAELIEGERTRVDEGNSIAHETAEALTEIVQSIVQAGDLVGEMSAASNEQARGIVQISQGLSQIDNVTQNNTATAEETAAAAEELSGQAEELRSLVAQFKLRELTEGESPTVADSPDWKQLGEPCYNPDEPENPFTGE